MVGMGGVMGGREGKESPLRRLLRRLPGIAGRLLERAPCEMGVPVRGEVRAEVFEVSGEPWLRSSRAVAVAVDFLLACVLLCERLFHAFLKALNTRQVSYTQSAPLNLSTPQPEGSLTLSRRKKCWLWSLKQPPHPTQLGGKRRRHANLCLDATPSYQMSRLRFVYFTLFVLIIGLFLFSC